VLGLVLACAKMTDDNQATELLYLTYDGNFKLETEATVLHCQIISNVSKPDADQSVRIELQLNQTTMHPQGGGQPTDLGTISCDLMEAHIDKVTIDRGTGIVTHAGSISIPHGDMDTIESSMKSKSVQVSVDPCNRRILSECHTAGHVVDAAMAKCQALLPPTKGYHFMDGPYVEYKGNIIENKDEFLDKLKQAYCQLIEEDIKTTIETVHMDEAESICNRVAKNFTIADFCTEENPYVRIVSVAGFSCPCGGTHVKSTGELKERGWCVKGLRCKKGVVRVRYGPKD
jgi:Ser-tRNA(Ala) deacylase AlaX